MRAVKDDKQVVASTMRAAQDDKQVGRPTMARSSHKNRLSDLAAALLRISRIKAKPLFNSCGGLDASCSGYASRRTSAMTDDGFPLVRC